MTSAAERLISVRGLAGALGMALVYFGALAGFLAACILLAKLLRIDEEVAFLGGMALALAVLTLVRPWWFWEHPKAQSLRGMVGDSATVVIYLALAFGFLWFAGFRARRIALARTECATLLASTTDLHSRMRILQARPSHSIPALSNISSRYTCGTFAELEPR